MPDRWHVDRATEVGALACRERHWGGAGSPTELSVLPGDPEIRGPPQTPLSPGQDLGGPGHHHAFQAIVVQLAPGPYGSWKQLSRILISTGDPEHKGSPPHCPPNHPVSVAGEKAGE